MFKGVKINGSKLVVQTATLAAAMEIKQANTRYCRS
jgi:hypothetical protein